LLRLKRNKTIISTEVRKIFLVAFSLMILFFIVINFSFKNPDKNSKPNIVIILVDDAGYADFGFMGCKDLLTPNIDQLAAQAIRFTDAHVTASVCSPSRAGLLTGKYQQRFGYECNEGDGYTGLDTLQNLIPKYLKQNGYNTAAFGKWHLGFEPSQHPLKKGFDYFYGFLSGGRSYFYDETKSDKVGAKTALIENHQQISFEGYLTDDLGNKAADYIKQNKTHPFFIYWAPNAVHTPMEASKSDIEKFNNNPRQQLAAMTFALDRAVGKIINELKQQGLFENTLIFFLSDNGGAHNNQSSNFPLKGFKGNKYEGGHRIPFLMSWPKLISKPTTFNGLTSSLDILPTILDAAKIKSTTENNFDGVSLLPFIQNKKNQNPHQQLVWRKDAAAAIRYNQYKLIMVNGVGEKLYDLSKDSKEENDIKNKKPLVYSKLKVDFNNWEKDKKKPLWTEGAIWDTITLMIHDDLMQNRKIIVHDPIELKRFLSSPK
jgi:arylsulfatase A-like enzyme